MSNKWTTKIDWNAVLGVDSEKPIILAMPSIQHGNNVYSADSVFELGKMALEDVGFNQKELSVLIRWTEWDKISISDQKRG